MAGLIPAYIAVEASGCGEDLTYWVLTQAQADEADQLAEDNGDDYCLAVGEVVDNHNLTKTGARCGTIKDAIDYMAAQGMTLVGDYNYISY